MLRLTSNGPFFGGSLWGSLASAGNFITLATNAWEWYANSSAMLLLDNGTQNLIQFNGAGDDIDVEFLYNGGNRSLSIDGAAGNVVIGPDAAIATSALEIQRATDFYVNLYNSGNTGAERGAYLQWYHSNGLGARIGAYRDNGDSDGMNIVFATEPVGGSLTARAYIDSDGRVGIGGLSTKALLEVYGNRSVYPAPQIRPGISSNPVAGVYATSANASGFVQSAEEDGTNWTARSTGACINRFANDGTIRFYSDTGLTSGNTFTPTERVRILAGLMVGTTTDSGAGWVRVATGVSLNGTTYTNPDYALSHYFEGSIGRFKDKPGADRYEGLVPLPKLEDYLRENFHLPNRWESENIFEWADMAQMWCEELAIYITQLHERVERLEAKHGNA
jgi:hypothetical protein